MIPLRRCFQAALLLAAATLSARGGAFFSDFNTGDLPPGTHTNANAGGGAYLELSGGVTNSGCLKITKNINSQNGSFVLDDLDAGQPIYGFDVTFKMRVGGGSSTPADGMALCVAPASDLSDTSIWGETGTGSGLRFTWGIYTGSGQTPPDPGIRVRIGPGGNIVAYKGYTVAGMETGGSDPSTWWADVHIRLNADGSLNFDYKGQNVFTNFFIPGYQEMVDASQPVRFGLGGRTGGLNENFWIDNLQITTFLKPQVGISQQPFSQSVQQGDNATFDVRITNPTGVSLQWYKDGALIPGATSTTLVVSNAQPALSGSKYKLTATGPNNTITSTEVTLTVINLSLPATPQLAFNFNDGTIPAGTAVSGTATVASNGGVNDSGSLQLTSNNNSQSGAFVVADPNAGQAVYGFTARFKALLGGGSVPPADGFAFAFGSDIPDDPTTASPNAFEEGQGLGTGLRVSFDIYNNDGIFGWASAEPTPAPSIDVSFGSQLVATRHLPLSFMETGVKTDGTPAYDDTIIQLNTDGTLNVVYRGALVFDQLPIPGFASIAGGRFALAARTGGLNENQWFDNIELTTVTNPGPVRVVASPASQTILVNHAVTFTVGVNNTNGVTYQWLRDGTAINGATTSAYTVPAVAVADSGAAFSAQATKGGTTVTSSNAVLTVVNLTAPAAPNYTFNFDNGQVPANTAIYGNAYIGAGGGVGGSGYLGMTDAINSQNSAFVIQPLFSGAEVSAISAAFDVRIGGGSSTPADGWSFNFASDLANGTVGNAEAGTGNGISIACRIYVGGGNADNPPSPYIGIKYKGAFVATLQLPASQLETGSDYRTVLFRVDPDGKAYLAFGERVLFNGLQLPNYTFISNGKFGFYARTGGLNDNQWFDNIRIQATKSTGPLAITTPPADALVLPGQTAAFSVTLSDPNGATYQWSKNGTNIAGATASSYTTPPATLADNGALFQVSAVGPGGTVTSRKALLTVATPITVTNPLISYNFNDGVLPEGTTLNSAGGGGTINVDDTGTNTCIHLTDAVNSEGGTFIIPDPFSNQPVSAITVHFSMRVGGGSAPPADGFSFVWCPSNELPANIVFSEDGAGSGLIVGVDIYDNGNETPPAPSIDLRWRGSVVASVQMPYQQLETGDQFGDIFVKVSSAGLVDVQYNGKAIFNQVALPGYAPLAGGEFAWGARTGGLNENQWLDNIQIAGQIGAPRPTLAFGHTGNSLTLSWGAGFKLQSSPSLTPANWTDVLNATSPYTTTMGPGSLYYRLAQTP